ncbi:hypothetical protein ElyMa_000932700 [Elysia marginata]|uniref:Uncharacterized protein n=1 Tax=Elysia marginata TaxID=1093978 RepID=A0AAV4HBB1_9GAST|nr:hypothetical protein ElyMa_000932700 [Elysia marginata]
MASVGPGLGQFSSFSSSENPEQDWLHTHTHHHQQQRGERAGCLERLTLCRPCLFARSFTACDDASTRRLDNWRTREGGDTERAD